MTPRERARMLAHDVGKYVARTARNVPGRTIALGSTLHAMLLEDLYALAGGQRASSCFASLREMQDKPGDARLVSAASCFAEIDALEPVVRAAEPEAIQRAAVLAVRVDELLRSFADGVEDGAR